MLSVLSFKGIIQAPKTEMERDRFSLQNTSFHYLKLPQWFFWWGEISHTWSQAQDICNTSIKLLATYWSECLGTMSSSNIKKKRLNTSCIGTEVTKEIILKIPTWHRTIYSNVESVLFCIKHKDAQSQSMLGTINSRSITQSPPHSNLLH